MMVMATIPMMMVMVMARLEILLCDGREALAHSLTEFANDDGDGDVWVMGMVLGVVLKQYLHTSFMYW